MTSYPLTLTVNGGSVSMRIDPRTLLVAFLRDELLLTGTHVGCDTAQCGACTILVDGCAVKACTVLSVQMQGADVLTIEGLAEDGPLHPMQEAFLRHHAVQCGFCTPGMVMAALDLVRREGHELDEITIRAGIDGNLCRCTGYQSIVAAIADGARAMALTIA